VSTNVLEEHTASVFRASPTNKSTQLHNPEYHNRQSLKLDQFNFGPLSEVSSEKKLSYFIKSTQHAIKLAMQMAIGINLLIRRDTQ
jgi:hypothetical protein